MTQDRPKTARDEALEMAKAKLPPHDPRHEHERIVDTALRMLGSTEPDQTAPREKHRDNADDEAQQIVDGAPEMLGGRAVDSAPAEPVSVESPSRGDLPTALSDAAELDVSDADVDMPGNLAYSASSSAKPVVPLPSPHIEPPEQLRITDIVSQITGNMDAAISWNEPGQAEAALDEIRALYKQIPAWPFPGENSRPVAPPITLGPEPNDASGKIEILPYRPSDDSGAKVELLADEPIVRRSDEARDNSAPSLRFPKSTSDGGPSLARPIVLLAISEVERQALIGDALRAAAERDERLLREIVEERIDKENYMRRVQERILYGDY